MSSSINPSAAGHHSKSYRRSAAEANGTTPHIGVVGGGNGGNGGAASDDSMHEKYFKSVENTPLSRRRHTTTPKGFSGATSASSGHGTGGSAGSNMKHSSDSSPQSPISPHNNKNKPLKVSSNIMGGDRGAAPMLHSPGGHSTCSGPPPSTSSHTHYKQDSSCSLELLNLDRLSLREGGGGGGSSNKTTSPHLSDITGHVSTTTNNMTSKNFPSSDNIGMMTHSSRGSNDSRGKHKTSTTGSWSQDNHRPNRNNSMSLVSCCLFVCMELFFDWFIFSRRNTHAIRMIITIMITNVILAKPKIDTITCMPITVMWNMIMVTFHHCTATGIR